MNSVISVFASDESKIESMVDCTIGTVFVLGNYVVRCVVSRKNVLRLLGREVVEFGGFSVSGGDVGWSRGCVIPNLG
jgi:hypothetical protein